MKSSLPTFRMEMETPSLGYRSSIFSSSSTSFLVSTCIPYLARCTAHSRFEICKMTGPRIFLPKTCERFRLKLLFLPRSTKRNEETDDFNSEQVEDKGGGQARESEGEGIGGTTEEKSGTLWETPKELYQDLEDSGKNNRSWGGFWNNFWNKRAEVVEEIILDDETMEKEAEREEEDKIEEVEKYRMEEMETPREEDKIGTFWRILRRGFGASSTENESISKRDDDVKVEVDFDNLEIQWRDLLDPTPENVLALLLTGLLAFASLQILWQLVLVAAAITLSALKYSVVAAILIALLIAFL